MSQRRQPRYRGFSHPDGSILPDWYVHQRGLVDHYGMPTLLRDRVPLHRGLQTHYDSRGPNLLGETLSAVLMP